MPFAPLLPLALSLLGTLAQASVAAPADWPLAQSVGQLGLGGIVAWMLWDQRQAREAERKREERRDGAMDEMARKLDCMARAMLLHTMQANPNQAAVDEVRDILNKLRDPTG